jgi:hypothetical protein
MINNLRSSLEILYISVLFARIKSDCGYPGLPENSKLMSPKIFYTENETVIYECDGYPEYYKQIIRKCINGSWTGSPPRCGKNSINLFKKIFFKIPDLEVLQFKLIVVFELFLRPENYFGSEKDSNSESRKY